MCSYESSSSHVAWEAESQQDTIERYYRMVRKMAVLQFLSDGGYDTRPSSAAPVSTVFRRIFNLTSSDDFLLYHNGEYTPWAHVERRFVLQTGSVVVFLRSGKAVRMKTFDDFQRYGIHRVLDDPAIQLFYIDGEGRSLPGAQLFVTKLAFDEFAPPEPGQRD
jgi:hypothetical protein